jgi:hypothetical protein
MAHDNVRRLRRPVSKNAVYRRRWKTNWMGQLWTASGRQPCIVADISAVGAKLLLDEVFDERTEVSLVLAGYPAILAEIAWCRRGWVGLNFRENQPAIFDLVEKAVKAGGGDPHGGLVT